MPSMTIQRPVWRQFTAIHLQRAADWVHAGGHAAVIQDDGRVDLILGVDEDGKVTEAGLWSILALEQQRNLTIQSGPAKGLRITRVAKHAVGAALDWCERDSAWKGPTRKIKLDCLDCGACCHESNVILHGDDIATFHLAGRPDLASKERIVRSRKDGKVRLRFLKNGRCPNLERDNRCAIYDLRPFNCSVFPVGSEACLAARESTLSLRDGV